MNKAAVVAFWNAVRASFAGNEETALCLHENKLYAQSQYRYALLEIGETVDRNPIWLPAEKFITLLKAAPGDTVHLRKTPKGVQLHTGAFRGVVPLLETGMEPPVDLDEAESVRVSGELWAGLVTAAEFAAEDENCRFSSLLNVLLCSDGLFGCNLLSVVHFPKIQREKALSIPRASILAANKWGAPPTHMEIDDYYIRWVWRDGGFLLTPTIMSDEYPLENIHKIDAASLYNKIAVDFDSQAMLSAIGRAARFHDQAVLIFQKNRVIVKSVWDVETTEVVPAKTEGKTQDQPFIISVTEARRFLNLSPRSKWLFGGGELENIIRSEHNGFFCCTMLTPWKPA